MNDIKELFAAKIELMNHLNFRVVCMDFFYTFIFSGIIGLILTIAKDGKHFSSHFIMSESFGLTICALTLFLLWLFKPQRWTTLILVSLLSIGSGALIGLQIGFFILRHFLDMHYTWPMAEIIRTVALVMLFSIACIYFFVTGSQLKRRGEMIEREKAERAQAEKEALEAKLRMLQAQIEPHFLFNTLSNVVSLIDTDPARGKAMLLDLTKYLRTSLSRTLPEATTLAQELDMIRAYLAIQKIRMGERLNFTIDAPDHLRGQPFPPMLLQPLVENAVRHGLEPKIDGGAIAVRAFGEDHLLKIEVSDSGLGIAELNANGVGMANVRERLRLLFGDTAKFMMEENSPSGVKAIIEVPIHD